MFIFDPRLYIKKFNNKEEIEYRIIL